MSFIICRPPEYCEGGKHSFSGERYYTVDGKTYKESGFKELREYSPEFRDSMIRQHLVQKHKLDHEGEIRKDQVCIHCGASEEAYYEAMMWRGL